MSLTLWAGPLCCLPPTPLLRTLSAFSAACPCTASFRAFGQIKLLTSGGPNGATTTLIYGMYENAFLNGRYETAYVQALALFVIIFIVTRIQTALEEKVVFYS